MGLADGPKTGLEAHVLNSEVVLDFSGARSSRAGEGWGFDSSFL